MDNIHIEPLGCGMEIFVSDTHHFSTDTILLADFSKPSGKKLCADLGTGCGTIPLLWLKQNKNLSVFAVELQKDACGLLEKSIERNGLEDNFTLLNADLRDLKGKLPFGAFDVVSCNPPYKLGGSGILNPEEQKLVARHEAECTLDDVCEAASKLLQFGGRLCVCNRPERLSDVMFAMKSHNIEPKRLRMVSKNADEAPWLFLIEGKKGSKPFMRIEPQLYIRSGDGFTDELQRIYDTGKD